MILKDFESELKKIDFSEINLKIDENDIFNFKSENRNENIEKIKELFETKVDFVRKSFRHNLLGDCNFLEFNIFSDFNNQDFIELFEIFQKNNLINERIEKKKKKKKSEKEEEEEY